MKFRYQGLTGNPRCATAHIAHGDTTSLDGRSLNDYDHEVTEWLSGGRQGPKPDRRYHRP